MQSIATLSSRSSPMNVPNALSPHLIRPEHLEPYWRWDRAIPSHGHMSVDFERRIDFDRLRHYRLARARAALKASGCGALLLFDVNNIRYVSGTKIGEWERDKLCRFALLAGDGEPIVWDFGSAAVHHRINCDWLLPENCKADMPVGVDIAETAMFFELQKAGMKVVDGQQVMLDAREIKNIDEIMLLNQAAAMVDGVYHSIYEALKPGVRENDIVALANKILYEMGSDDVEAINAISVERCNPHPHNFTDRILRPGDQAFFDILHSLVGYRTCYYRTFNVGRATPVQHDAYTQCRQWLDDAIALIKPGVSTDTVAKVWPKAEEFGFPSEMSAFGLQFGHGLGLALHERPIISRLVSLENPMEIKTGMVFALETYCPAKDGFSAARIEEEVVVTDKGCQVITLFPAEELPIANRY